MDHRKVTIFLNSAGNNYPIFKLFQTKNDPSIYLHMSKHNELRPSGVGKITFSGFPLTPLIGRIEYANAEVFFKPIDHSSIHKDGRAHTKFFDKTYYSRTSGLPLENLKGARHLWTIIPGLGSFKDENIVTKLPKDYLTLNMPEGVRTVAFVIFAIPKNVGQLDFQFQFPVDDLDMDDFDKETDMKKFPMNITALPFNHFIICFFVYWTLKFKSPPPLTYAFSDIFNLVPFVKQVNEQFIELELRAIISPNKDF